MATTMAMTVVDVNLVIMDQTVEDHKFSPDGQLPLTLMKTGNNLLTLFDCYVHVILATVLFWKNVSLVKQD